MILKASQRGGAGQLARHLLKAANEHVEVHEIRGFMADDLTEALSEAYAVSRGTRCRQFLFSVSFNPPEHERVPVEAFESAIDRVERGLGLEGRPRAVVFHEKEGRRHAHCVWSRIDTAEMKAVNMAFFKRKLRDISRELYLEHDWRMPLGLVDSQERDPATFSLAEWQQARRAGEDPKALKVLFQDCWAISDSRASFAAALEARGYHLAQGERRGFVALDYRGEAYAIARWTGKRAKEVKARLGDPATLPTVTEAKAKIAARMTAAVRGYIRECEAAFAARDAALEARKADLTNLHRQARARLNQHHEARWIAETNRRAARMSRGFRGIWDRLTGRHAHIRRENENEAWQALQRDQAERDDLIERHLDQRRALQAEVKEARRGHAKDLEQLRHDVAYYMELNGRQPVQTTEHFQEAASGRESSGGRRPAIGRDRGPEL